MWRNKQIEIFILCHVVGELPVNGYLDDSRRGNKNKEYELKGLSALFKFLIFKPKRSPMPPRK